MAAHGVAGYVTFSYVVILNSTLYNYIVTVTNTTSHIISNNYVINNTYSHQAHRWWPRRLVYVGVQTSVYFMCYS